MHLTTVANKSYGYIDNSSSPQRNIWHVLSACRHVLYLLAYKHRENDRMVHIIHKPRLHIFVAMTLLIGMLLLPATVGAGVWTLTVQLDPSQGSITTSDGRTCTQTSCTYSLSYGNSVTLYANPNDGYAFDHWNGECSGKPGNSCMINTGNPSAQTGAFFRVVEPPASPADQTSSPAPSSSAASNISTPGHTPAPHQAKTTTASPDATPTALSQASGAQTTNVAVDTAQNQATEKSSFKITLGLIAVIISIIGYIPYYRDILRGKTKPHAFSWLVWSILNGIAFAGQLHDKGGAGAWAVGLTAAALCGIFVLSLFRGERDIKPFDWYCLGGAGLGLAIWLATNQPLLAVIVITIVDLFGFLPTIRKAYVRPHQETLVTYMVNTAKYFLVVGALERYTTVTLLFPLAVAMMNAAFVVLLLVRRRSIHPASH